MLAISSGTKCKGWTVVTYFNTDTVRVSPGGPAGKIQIASTHSAGRLSAVAAALLLATVALLPGCKGKDTTPPGNVTGLAAAAGDGTVALTWTNPADLDFAGVRVQRRTDQYPAAADDGDTVFEGLAAAANDTGLQNATLYYYTVFSVDLAGNHASGAQVAATPVSAIADPEVLTGFSEMRGAIDAVPDTALAADQRGELKGLLGGAEQGYRGGDPCGAGGGLRALLGRLQDFRADNAVSDCERLYNDARMLRRAMALKLPNKDQCVEFERIDRRAAVLPDAAASGLEMLTADASFGEPLVVTRENGGKVFTDLNLPGIDFNLAEPGHPVLPVARRLFAVPEGAEVAVAFEVTPAETIQMNLWPAQPETMDAIQPLDPFAKPPFTLNPEVYGANTLFPAEPVRISSLGRMRGVRVYQLEMSGGQYNPATQTLSLFDHIHATLAFQGGSGQYGTAANFGAFEEAQDGILGSLANWDIVKQKYVPPVVSLLGVGEEFMILTPPDFRDAADRLAAWKNNHGVITKVFTVADGAGRGPDTLDGIDDLIENEYDRVTPRPAYVLLLGDAEFIPPAYINAMQPADAIGSATIGTDWPYSKNNEESTTGLLPDLAVGRLSVDTLEEADRCVDRIIAYEGAPPQDANFYSRAMIASQFQCCNVDSTTKGMDQRTFIRVSEFSRNLMANHGKTVDRIYVRTVDSAYTGSTKPKYYDDGTALPADVYNLAWNGTTQQIIDGFNAGRFLVIHRDHGSPGAWGSPWFRWSNIYGDDTPTPDPKISNGALLPLVFSVNCASGMFDDETSGGAMGAPADFDYLVERFIRSENGGAIGVIGDTRNSPSTANSLLLQGFLDAMWPDALSNFGGGKATPRLGDILAHGKNYLSTQTGNFGDVNQQEVHDELLMWHTFGDPTLAVWTDNPYTRGLPDAALGFWVGDRLYVFYAVDGVTVTATQSGAEAGMRCFGRGVIKDGYAILDMLGFHAPGLNTHLAFSRVNSITVEATVAETQSPPNVANFTIVPHKDILMLSWDNPGGDFSFVRVLRKTTGFPVNPTDGEIVVNGNGDSYFDGPLDPGVTYYYTAFSYDVNGNRSDGVSASGTTWSDITPPAEVTNFQAVPGKGSVQLSWTNPTTADFTGVKIIRKQGSAPFSDTDGAVIYDGPGTGKTDTGLTTGVTYYYGAYTHDGWPNYSWGKVASATPTK